MSFELLLGASLALYLLLNFAILPRLTSAWKASRRISKIGKAGLLSGLQSCRDTALVACVMYLLFAFLTVALAFTFGHNTTVLGIVVRWADRCCRALKSIKSVVDSYFFLIPAALIVYLSWLRQRNEFRGRFERMLDDEYDRLNRERQQGLEWANLEPDERMRVLDAEIEGLEKQISSLEPEAHWLRQNLRRRVVKAQEERNDADYERRVRLGEFLGEEDRAGAGWRRFLLSQGLFSDLKGATKLLSRVTLATLSIALIGLASSSGLSQTLWNRVVTLDDLRVQVTKAAVDRSWKEQTASAPNQQPSADDQSAIARLADDFASALAHNPNWRPLGQSVRATAEVQRRLARRAILAAVQLPGADRRTKSAFVDDLPTTHQEILREVSRERSSESFVGRAVSEQESPNIKSFFGSKWEKVKASVLEHAKTYHEPVRITDLESSLVDRIVSAAFDGLPSNGEDSEIVKQARGAMNTVTKKAVNEAVTTEFHQVVQDLANGESYPERIAKVATEDIPFSKPKAETIATLILDRHLPDFADLDQRTSAASGSWRSPEDPPRPDPPPPPAPDSDRPNGGGSGGGGAGSGAGKYAAHPPNADAADAIVRDIAKHATQDGKYSLPEESIDAMAQYEDHFPRSIASATQTPLARTLERFRLPVDATSFSRLASLKVTRASSFSMLRGFSRVGGVLIGEEPENPKAKIDIRNLTWSFTGQSVILVLTDASGRSHQLGPYDRSLVHQALGYAADGRPVAVTMTKARPLPQLKIHLHPSLVDTPLGCRMTHLDRLVDTYAGSRAQLPQRGEMTERYAEQFAVYNLAWAHRWKALVSVVERQSDFERQADEMMNKSREAGQRGLMQPELFKRTSIFRRKSEFFDQDVLGAAEGCWNRDREAFENCLSRHFESARARAVEKRDMEKLQRWLVPPATFEPWSGVRERKFRITRDMSFLRPPEGNSVRERLWPFDFIVQIAFTSTPVNLPQKEIANYVDTRPIEFFELEPKIGELVMAGIERDGLRETFQDLRAFTVLQRLFRAALHGNLGDRFPLEQLARLTRATAADIPYFHTARWNGSVTTEIVSQLAQASAAGTPSPWMRTAAEQAAACLQALARATEKGEMPGSVCDFSQFRDLAEQQCPKGDTTAAACHWRSITKMGPAFSTIVQAEIGFGVLADHRATTDGGRCPALAPQTSSADLPSDIR